MRSWIDSADKTQLEALEFASGIDSAGLLLPPGYGKTSIALMDMMLNSFHGRGAALCIVPLRPLYATWPKEVRAWSQFSDMRVAILHGPKREEALKKGADLYLINPENFAWLLDRPKSQWPFRNLYVDESSKFKNPSSQRFKYLRTKLDEFDNRRILTGSFRPQSIEDIWSQIFILDGGFRLGRYITHFRNRYMVDVAPPRVQWSDWQPAPGAEAEVRQKISDICYVAPDDRAPPVERNIIDVEMPAAAMKIYRQMEKEFLAELKSGALRVSAVNAGAKAMKLRQLANGFLYDDGKEGHPVHTAKLDAVADLMDELNGEPVLIAVQFKWEADALIRMIKKNTGVTVPYLGSGGLPASKMPQMIADWNAGRLPAVVAHPASASHGIDEMQKGGRTVCWFANTYNYDEFDQLNRRLRRRGQEKVTRVHQIAAIGTLDRDMIEITDAKGTRQSDFLNLMIRRNQP